MKLILLALCLIAIYGILLIGNVINLFIKYKIIKFLILILKKKKIIIIYLFLNFQKAKLTAKAQAQHWLNIRPIVLTIS
jgi:hypothetical protein